MSETGKKAIYEFFGVKICGTISLIPCILLIIIYIIKKKLTLSMYINFNLCITAIFYSISGLFPKMKKNDLNNFSCHFQVVLGTTGDISILLWTGTISVIGTLSYIYQETIEKNENKMKLIVTIIVYGIVIIFNICFQGLGEIDVIENNYYCWINNYYVKMSYTIFIVIIFIVNIIANVILMIEVNKIKKKVNDNENLIKKLNKFSCILWKYIIALILIFLSNIIHFIQHIKSKFNNDEYQELPIIFDVLLQSFNYLKGFIVCFVYTYNDEFYDDLFNMCKCNFDKIKDDKEINLTNTEETDKSYYNAIDFFDPLSTDIEIPV